RPRVERVVAGRERAPARAPASRNGLLPDRDDGFGRHNENDRWPASQPAPWMHLGMGSDVNTEAGQGSRGVFLLQVEGLRSGLPAAEVRELLRVVTLTPVPSRTLLLEGVINLRGRVVPVLDLRAWLRLPPKEVEITDYLIVAQVGPRPLTLRVDRALG